MDTNANSSETKKPWAWWAALVMLAAGGGAVLYVLFAASSKPHTAADQFTRLATGEMAALTVLPTPPPMPTRALSDARNTELTLEDFRGEVLVVNLWATTCPPCIEEMPTLAEAQIRYDGRLRIIPISVDREPKRADAQRMLRDLAGGVLPFVIDTTSGVLFDVQAPGMPTTIIYDREGREVARLAGAADWSSEEAYRLFDAVLADAP